MFFKKRISKTCIILVFCMLANVITYAEPVNTDVVVQVEDNEYLGTEFLEEIVNVYELLSGETVKYEGDIAPGLAKAIEIGLIDKESIENYNHPLSKQNAASFIYNIIKRYRPEFEISAEEERAILNLCYDNGKLYTENRAAFAFCLKHGILRLDAQTNPGEPVTKEQGKIILSRVYDYFNDDVSFNVGGKTVTMNEKADVFIEKFGQPNRIDKTIYGFSWYVYNSSYSDFFMAGIKEDRVCAFYSNAQSLEFRGVKPGDNYEFSGITGLNIYPDEAGGLDAIFYNPNEIVSENDEETLKAMESELGDFINAHRTADGKLALNMIDDVNMVHMLSESAGQNVAELYYGMIMQKAENADIINETISTSADMEINITVTDTGSFVASAATNSGVFGILPEVSETVEPEVKDFSVKKPLFVEAPEIVSFESGAVLDKNNDVTLELKKSVSDKYFIKIFDVELQKDIVCQYITSEEKEFVFPKELFTAGADYIIEMCALDGEETLYGEAVEFTFGDAANPVYIEYPCDGSYTYDSELEVYVSSSVYHDFRFEIINSRGEVVVSVRTTDTKAAILESIPSGKYTLKATALKRNTDAERGVYSINFEVKKVHPQINTYILEPDETFNFIYESSDSKYMYFYDEDIVYVDETIKEIVTETVTEKVTETVIDENGEQVLRERDVQKPIEKEVEKVVKSPRKRIIQKKVPATKQYRKLRCMYTSKVYTTGAISNSNSTKTGDSIANTALLYQGIPYVWGGETPSGFDCSGLVKYVCNKLGIKVHRTSAEQFAYDGRFVLKSELIPGDLLFFQDNGVIHHVGIYIGDGKMVHAPHTGDVVRVASINSDYYVQEYAGAKRVSD